MSSGVGSPWTVFHVDGDPGRALIVARVHQAGRHLSEPLFARTVGAMIAGQDLVLAGLAANHDGRQKAIARDRLA